MSVKKFLPTFNAPLAPYTVFYMYLTLTSEMLLYISGYNNKKKNAILCAMASKMLEYSNLNLKKEKKYQPLP